MSPSDFAKALAAGIDELGLTIPSSVQAALLEFLQLLLKWNKAYNLTAITDPNQMITQHVLDSLSIAAYCHGNRILDVGSGAGFPGIPLALTFPEKSFVLLDSQQKKTTFLIQAVATFKIVNVSIVRARVEQYVADACFDTIICRAFGTIEDILEKTRHLLCAEGRWLLMKGVFPREELEGLALPYSVQQLKVPGLGAERHLVIIENQRDRECLR